MGGGVFGRHYVSAVSRVAVSGMILYDSIDRVDATDLINNGVDQYEQYTL